MDGEDLLVNLLKRNATVVNMLFPMEDFPVKYYDPNSVNFQGISPSTPLGGSNAPQDPIWLAQSAKLSSNFIRI